MVSTEKCPEWYKKKLFDVGEYDVTELMHKNQEAMPQTRPSKPTASLHRVMFNVFV